MTLIIGSKESLIIQTRKGNPIPNWVGQSLSPFRVEKDRESIKRQYSRLSFVERKQPTGAYNCHGLTFLNRRAELNESDSVQMVLDDDEYFEIALNDAQPGDIAVYKEASGEISHTAVVIQNDDGIIKCPTVLSKWGKAGEYIHKYNSCPYMTQGCNVLFMREGQND